MYWQYKQSNKQSNNITPPFKIHTVPCQSILMALLHSASQGIHKPRPLPADTLGFLSCILNANLHVLLKLYQVDTRWRHLLLYYFCLLFWNSNELPPPSSTFSFSIFYMFFCYKLFASFNWTVCEHFFIMFTIGRIETELLTSNMFRQNISPNVWSQQQWEMAHNAYWYHP